MDSIQIRQRRAAGRLEVAGLVCVSTNFGVQYRGHGPFFSRWVESSPLVQQAYAWGARNCEIHFAQCLGPWQPPSGVVMPTYLPETG